MDTETLTDDREFTPLGVNGTIMATCSVCRKLFLTSSPERAVAWALEHAHQGDLLIAEVIALQESEDTPLL